MEKKMEAKLNMFQAVNSQCADNSTIISTVPAFADSSTQLSGVILSIRANNLIVESSIKGAAQNKKDIKLSMIDLSFLHSSALFAFAVKTNNLELKAKVDFSKSDLKKEKDSDIADTCQMIADLALKNLTDLAPYGITAPDIATLQTLIDNYLQVLPSPKTQKAHKQAALNKIKELFIKGDSILKNEMDKTVLMLKKDHSDFVEEYFINREITDASTIHTALSGVVKVEKTGVPVKAKIEIVELQQNFTTGENGEYEFKPVKFGVYTIKAEGAEGGYIPKTIEKVKVKLGENTHLDIELVPA